MKFRHNHSPMPLTLESLSFCRPGSRRPFAPLRRKQGEQPVSAPEWQAGLSVDFADSPVAAILNAAPLNPCVVTASFRSDQALAGHIQAVPAGGLGFALRQANVNLPAGPATVDLQLTLDAVDAVGVRDLELLWRFRPSPNSPWSDPFAQSRHRLYTLLAAPGAPWSLDPLRPERWLWTDVLDVACARAAGATSAVEALQHIVRWYRTLGRTPANPNGLSLGATALFTSSNPPHFDCRNFLRFLREGLSHTCCSCTDGAAAVSTFANAVGAASFQARMAGGVTRPALLLGHPQPKSKRFAFHEVAWDGVAGESDTVWDGSLQLLSHDLPVQDVGVPYGGVYLSYSALFYQPGDQPTPLGLVTLGNRPLTPDPTLRLSGLELTALARALHPEVDLDSLPEPSPSRFDLDTLTGIFAQLGALYDRQSLPPDRAAFGLDRPPADYRVLLDVLSSREEARAALASRLLDIEVPLTPRDLPGVVWLAAEGVCLLGAGNAVMRITRAVDCYGEVEPLVDALVAALQ